MNDITIDELINMVQKDSEEGKVITSLAKIREEIKSLPSIKDFEDEDE